MFSKASSEDWGVRVLIGDTGPGLDRESIESRGKGTEIIEEVILENGARFATYTNERVEKMELEDVYQPEEDIGALFELRIPYDSDPDF